MRKKKPTCFRCGRQFEEGKTYSLIWVGTGMAPVCHDDKTCEERVYKKNCRRKKAGRYIRKYKFKNHF